MKSILPLLALSFLVAACAAAPKTQESEKLGAIRAHERAVHIKEDGWIRDPFITLGPDGKYYLTGTTRNPAAGSDGGFNTGLGDSTVVGDHLRVWSSDDMVDWTEQPTGYSVSGYAGEIRPDTTREDFRYLLWAPELHWDAVAGRWIVVHCPAWASALATTSGEELTAPWEHTSPRGFFRKHDPSLFLDDDGVWYMAWANTMVAPIKPDFSGLAAQPVSIDPEDRKIGHEGALIKKIGGKYVHFGTAWSTDKGRHGSYNLYYCTADKVTGPYSERRFAGRFLGHGTPFQDKSGNWWCTAFFNANVPPLPREGIRTRDLSQTAQTINPQGTTIVPLVVETLPDGDVYIRAKDPDYAIPGPDEVWPVNEITK